MSEKASEATKEKARDIYRELAIKPIQEAIGDNKIDNMMQDLQRTTEVELQMFVADVLQRAVTLFQFDYENPKFEGFREAFEDIKDRYQVMSGEDQGDLFQKIESMFKDIFVKNYAGASEGNAAEAAEATAKLYANQMVDVLKSHSIQANTELYPAEKSWY